MGVVELSLVFVSTYVNVLLLGLQSKNIQRSMYALAFFTSLGITVTSFLFVKFAAAGDDLLFVAVAGLGGALGIISSIWLHDNYLGRLKSSTGPMHKIVYLAGPYTDEDPAVMEERFEALTKIKAKLLNEGVLVYSPITAGHATAVRHDLPREYGFWQRHCEAFVSRSDEVAVVTLPGWQGSRGVNAEIALATERGIPVRFLSADYADV